MFFIVGMIGFVLVSLFLVVGASMQGINKAKADAYLAGKYEEENKKK